MLNRKFTFREILLLIITAVVGLGIFYYEIFYKGYKNGLEKYNTDDIQTEILIAQGRAVKRKQMLDYIANNADKVYGEVATYNNLAFEILELNSIFNGVDELTIVWSDPVLTDSTVRRNVSISFSTIGYQTVVELIDQLAKGQYRCLIKDINITTLKDVVLDENVRVKTNLNVTFYEKVEENTSLQGLTIVE